uniref:Uncharacterized protein n=1 Tax=Trichuris muris TaxID=70415 RepID=A0A5S6Q9S8_TRIMR
MHAPYWRCPIVAINDSLEFVNSDIIACVDSSRNYGSSLLLEENVYVFALVQVFDPLELMLQREVIHYATEAVEVRKPLVNGGQSDDKKVGALVDIASSPATNIKSGQKSAQAINCVGVFLLVDVVRKAIAFRNEHIVVQPGSVKITSVFREPAVSAAARVPFGTNEVTVPLED